MLENLKIATEEDRRARGRPRLGDLASLEARLIRVARQRFITNGYSDTSMNEIAYAARVSKGTLYARFASKAALFSAIVEAHMAQGRAALVPVLPECHSLESSLIAYIGLGLKFNASVGVIELNRLIFAEAPRSPDIGKVVEARAKTAMRRLSELIAKFAITDGTLCRNPDEPAAMIATLARGFFVDIVHREHPTPVAEIEEWTGRAIRLFLLGRQSW